MLGLHVRGAEFRQWMSSPGRTSLLVMPLFMAGLDAQQVSIEEALDVEGQGLVFTTDTDTAGNPSWFGQAAFSADGVDALEVRTSGLSIVHDLSTVVQGPLKVRFLAEYRTDPDPGDAWFEFLVDGTARFSVWGNTFGEYQEFLEGVGPGVHELTWRYVKEISFVSGQFVRVDGLELRPPGEGPPLFHTQPEALLDRWEGAAVALTGEAVDADSYQWFKDDEAIPDAVGPTLDIPVLSLADNGRYHVEAINASGSTVSNTADLRVWTAAEIPEVLDYTGPGAITFSGDGVWVPTRLRSDAGESSLASPPLAHGESAEVRLEVSGPSRVDFDWRTDCERWDDVLELLVDGVAVNERSGAATSDAFTGSFVTLAPGDHLLCWRYRKDAANSHYADQVWLDNIRVTSAATGGAPPAIESPPVSLEVEPGNAAVFSLGLPAEVAQPATVTWRRAGDANPVGTGTALVIPEADPALHAGDYIATVTNANGSVDSNAVTLTVRRGFLSDLVEVHRPPTSQRLRALVAVPDGPVLAFGDGVMLTSRDGGQTYEASNPFFGGQILAAAASPDGEVVAVGPGGTLWCSADEGTTWQREEVPTRESLRAASWVPSSDNGHPNGFFGVVGNRGTLLRRALDGDTAWTKVEVPGAIPRDGTGCDAVGESLVFVTGQGNFMGVCDLLTGTCGDLIPLDQLGGSIRGVCGDERTEPPICWVIGSTGDLLQCELDGSGPPPVELPGPGLAIDCQGDDLLIAMQGAIQVGEGLGAGSIALPGDLRLDDLVAAGPGGILGCGSDGVTVACTTAGGCELTSSEKAPAVGVGPGVVVAADGSVTWHGQSIGPLDPKPADVVTIGDTAVLPLADLAAAPSMINGSGQVLRSDWDRSGALTAGETLAARTWVRHPNATGTSFDTLVEVAVTSEGRVLCGSAVGVLDDVTGLLPGTSKVVGAGQLALAGTALTVMLLAEDGVSYYLSIDENGVKSWRPLTVSIPDLRSGERVVEVAISPTEHVLARTNQGSLIATEPGGEWARREDISGSGNVRIAYKPGEGFLVFDGAGQVYVIAEDLGDFRKVLTGTPFPSRVLVPRDGGSLGLLTSAGGVLEGTEVGPEVRAEVRVNGATIPSGVEGNKGVCSGEVVPIEIEFEQPVTQVRIVIDGQPAVEVPASGPGERRFLMNWNAPAPGAHHIEIEAVDGADQVVFSYQTDLWVFLPLTFEWIDSGEVVITWDGGEVLQCYDEENGLWTDLPGAVSPYERDVDPELAAELFRLQSP